MKDREEYNFKMERAMQYLQHERHKYRSVQGLLAEMKRRGLIEEWKVDVSGFVKIKAGGKWRGTLLR